MLFGKYKFLCSLENDAILPSYKGSTFRGVFGWALKKTVCALRQQECGQCLLKERCVYSLLFETPQGDKPGSASPVNSVPHPFVIKPPLTTRTRFVKGAPFDFDLLVFGEANKNLPYFVYAFETMGKMGIGKKVDGNRARFVLNEVRAGGDVIYTDKTPQLETSPPEQLTLEAPDSQEDQVFRLEITLETPLRLKFENRLQADLPFHVLVRAMLRRVSSLMSAYDGGEPDLDYRGLVQRGKAVSTHEKDLRWYDWKRYSSRQDKIMLMGGITGSVTYEGKLGEFLPLLDFCSKVNIGKQTAFGLGKIKINTHTRS